jgi:hypothetical protein
VNCNREEALQVLYGVADANSVQQNLQGVNGHVDDVFIFSSELEHVDNLVNNRNFEVLVFTEVVLENQLDDADELHQEALFQDSVLALFLVQWELQVKCLKETDWEV